MFKEQTDIIPEISTLCLNILKSESKSDSPLIDPHFPGVVIDVVSVSLTEY